MISTSNEYIQKRCIELLPERYRPATLDTCSKLPKGLVDFGKEWARTWPLTSLLLFGIYGCGKTHFAYALIRELLKLGRFDFWPIMHTSPELDGKLLEASKGPGGDRHLISELSNCELLFIDDIGRETRSDRLRRQYFEIFNNRYIHKRPTILTSNYSLEELGVTFDDAIISRMQESWQPVAFPKKNLREEKVLRFD